MSDKWKKIVGNIIAYAVSAVLGALGFSAVSGCASIPCFFF